MGRSRWHWISTADIVMVDHNGGNIDADHDDDNIDDHDDLLNWCRWWWWHYWCWWWWWWFSVPLWLKVLQPFHLWPSFPLVHQSTPDPISTRWPLYLAKSSDPHISPSKIMSPDIHKVAYISDQFIWAVYSQNHLTQISTSDPPVTQRPFFKVYHL